MQRKTEVKQENVLRVSQASIVRACEVGVIRELHSNPIGQDVPDASAQAQFGDVVLIELVKRLRARHREPRLRFPRALPRSEWNINLEETADPAGLIPIVRGEFFRVPGPRSGCS